MQLAATTTLIQWNPNYSVNQIYTKTNYCKTDHRRVFAQNVEKSADWWTATTEGGKKRVHLILVLFVDKQDLGDMSESL